FAPLEQIGNLASYGLRLFVTPGRFDNAQRIVGRKWLMRLENKQFLEDRPGLQVGPAEFRERFFRERFVLDKSLPRPLRELRRPDIRRAVEQHDGAAFRQSLD